MYSARFSKIRPYMFLFGQILLETLDAPRYISVRLWEMVKHTLSSSSMMPFAQFQRCNGGLQVTAPRRDEGGAELWRMQQVLQQVNRDTYGIKHVHIDSARMYCVVYARDTFGINLRGSTCASTNREYARGFSPSRGGR